MLQGSASLLREDAVLSQFPPGIMQQSELQDQVEPPDLATND